MLMELEQRIAFDAAGAATVEQAGDKANGPAHGDAGTQQDSAQDQAAQDKHTTLVTALRERSNRTDATSAEPGDTDGSGEASPSRPEPRQLANDTDYAGEDASAERDDRPAQDGDPHRDLSGYPVSDSPGPSDASGEQRAAGDAAGDDASGQEVGDTVIAQEDGQGEQVFFIDENVADRESLIEDLPEGAQVVIVSAGADGLQQVADYLEGRHDIEAIHILSHGEPGAFQLGDGVYSNANIGAYSEILSKIGSSLTTDGDILIYSCDVAGGENGEALLSTLATLTKADIAASDDATGNAALGGDWILEARSGTVESRSFSDPDYELLLAANPIVDLNSTATPTNIVTNGTFTGGTSGWTTSLLNTNYIGTAGAGGAVYWNVELGTGTITQTGLTGLKDGPGTNGAAQVIIGVGWNNPSPGETNSPATLTINIGGVDYARVTTGINGSTTATVQYLNGASGPTTTLAASTYQAWTYNDLVINLPTSVAASGSLVATFSSSVLLGSGDDISIDNVRVLTNVDPTAGVNHSATYVENGPAVSIADTDSSIRDSDSATLSSATIVLTNAQAGDVLSVGSLPPGITGSINTSVPGQITVTLSGTASTADYAAAIRAVGFSNPGDNIPTATRVINVVVNDGTLTSGTATTTINISAVNDPPQVSMPATQATLEDTPLVFSAANGNAIAISDVDGTGETYLVRLTIPAATGTLTLGSTSGLLSVSGNGTNEIFVTGTIANINAALNGLRYQPTADFNGSVPAGLSITVSEPSSLGFVNAGFEEPNFTGTPNFHQVNESTVPGWETSATDNLIEIWDSGFNSVTAFEGNQFAELNATQASTLSQTFTPTEAGSPIQLAFAHRGRFGTDTMRVVATDLGADGVFGTSDDILLWDQQYSDGTTWRQYAADLGIASGNSIRLAFTAISAAGGVTQGNFVDGVSIFDASSSSTASMTIGVAAVADIVPDQVTTLEGTPVTFNVVTGANETSGADNFENAGRLITAINGIAFTPGSPISITGGTITVAADGTVTFTPATNFAGTTSFTYTVTSGGVTETATATITVTDINDAPAGTDRTVTINEDTSYAFTAADFGFTDPNDSPADALQSVVITTLPPASAGILRVGGVAVTAGQELSLAQIATLTFTPAADANGAALASFTFQVRDDGGVANGGINLDPTANAFTFNVTAVNDAPVNTLPASGWTTSEDTALGLTGLAVADIDAGGGVITVTLSVTSGTLAATGGGGVGVTGSGTGAIVLSGTLANINAYLAGASRPTFTPATNFSGTVTLTMATNDGGFTGTGGALTDTDSATIIVNPVNDAPTLDLDASGTGTGFTNTYTENGPAVAIADTDSLITDVDNPNMGSLTVAISNGQAGDILSIDGVLPAGISASYNPATFVLTLTGTASMADYQAALEQIRFSSTSENPSTTPRTLSVTVNDGTANSTPAIATINIVAVNDAPVNTLPPGGWTTSEDNPVGLTGLDVADPDSGGASITVTLTVTSGTLTAAASGGVAVSGSGSGTIQLTGTAAAINAYLAGVTRPAYTPVADFNGSVTLTMTTNDGGNSGTGGVLTDVDTATITVSPVTDIAADTVNANEDTPATISPLLNDTFENPAPTIVQINGTPIAVNGVVSVANGTVRLNADGTLFFTPAADYSGTTQFTYTVRSGGVDETATVTVNVAAVADPPVNTVPGPQSTVEDTPLAIGGISVADPDGGTVTTTLSLPNGTLSVSGGGAAVTGNGTGMLVISGTAAQVNAALASLQYTPLADHNGPVQLTVQTSDGTATDTDTVAITVTAVADITADAVTTAEDTPVSFNVLTGTNGATPDNFENPGRVVTAVTQPPAGQGTVTFAANGTITYTPAADFTGTTSFTYTVTSGGVTETATVTVTVNAVNDVPANTVPGAQTTAEDVPVVFSSANGNAITVGDVDNTTLTVTLTATNGTFSLSGTAGLAFITGDGTSDATMTFSGTAAAINAALAGARYVPAADYNGPAQVSIATSDGTLSDSDTIAITVTPVIDIAADTATTSESTSVTISVLANDTFENPGRTITAVNGTAITAGGPPVSVANGSVQLNASGQLVFTPAANFNGNVSFTYTVTSGGVTETATVSVAVASVNTPPTNTLPATFGTLEDTQLALAGLAISDLDAGAGTVTVTLSVDAGLLTANSTADVTVAGSGTSSMTLSGTVADINAYLASANRPTYTPAPNATGAVTLTMRTSDNGNTGGPALEDVDTATIIITPVNDAPAGTDRTVTIDEDTAYTFSAGDFGLTDPNDNPVNSLAAVIITTVPANGVLALGGVPVVAGQSISAGVISQLTWTPAANASGTAAFTFQVQDNGGIANGGQNTDPSPNTFTINVQPVNDAPVNTLPASFGTSEDSPVPLTGLQIADLDANTGGMTVTLTVSSGTLSATGGGGVTVSGSGTGTITLTGTLADINSYLATSAPTFAPAANANGPVTLTMLTDDNGNTGSGGNRTDLDIATITVTPMNDAPVASDTAIVTNEDTAFTGNLPPATDVDGDDVTYAPGSTSPSHGTVAIQPDGSYVYTPTANHNGPDTFTYTITDGTVTVEYTVTVTVNPENDPPVAVNDNVTTGANTAASVNVIANDTDADADALTVTQVNGGPAGVGVAVEGNDGGTFTIGADGSATFNPDGDFADLAAGEQRTTSVTYQVSDGNGGLSTATLTVTVVGVNDSPASTPIPAQSSSDGQTISLSVAGNFTDPDNGDTLTFTAMGLPAGLTISSAGLVTGTIDNSASQSGPYSVTVTATDAGGLQTSRTFTWAVTNPAPVAQDDALSTTENQAISGSVFTDNGNGVDGDPDGDSFAVSAVGGSPSGVNAAVAGSDGGTFTINSDGTYGFDPGTAFDDLAPGEIRTTSVTYTISDGEGGTSTATVSVTVTGQNDGPAAANDNVTTSEDTPVTFDVRTNDSDIDGGTLTVTQIEGTDIDVGEQVAVTGGSVTLNPDGTLTFTPDGDFNGTPSFSYTIADGQGGTTTATVNLTVNPVQDAPVAADDTFTTNEDVVTTIDVLANDDDIDGDALTITRIDGSNIAPGGTVVVSGGTVTLNPDGTLSFAPDDDFNGTPSFTYTVSDGHGGTAVATVTGTVNPLNDPPVSNDLAVITPEDVRIDGTLPPASDIDGDTPTYSPGSVDPTNGTVTINADGTYTYVPDANFNGTDTFSFVVSDGNGGQNEYTVTVTVTPGNDAPVSSDISVTTDEDTTLNGNLPPATDIDGDTPIYSAGPTLPAHGTVTINADGTYTYIPAPDFNGTDTFSFIVSDGNGGQNEYTVTVNVTGDNDAPVGLPIPDMNEVDGAAFTYDVAQYFSDEDGDALNYTVTGLPLGLAIDPATGIISGTIDGSASQAGAGGVYTVTVTAHDRASGMGLSDAVTFQITVTNPAPTAAHDTVTVAEDATAIFNVLTGTGTTSGAAGADIDPDGDQLAVTAASAGNGMVVVGPNGEITYTPNADFHGTDTIMYTISDGEGGVSSATVTVTVTPVNDDPVANPIPSQIDSDGENVSLDVSGYFDDVDGDALEFSATGLPPGLSIDQDTGVIGGNLDPNASVGGPYAVIVTADDGNGGIVSQTITWHVMNLPPAALSDALSVSEDGPAGNGDALTNDSDPDGDPIQVDMVNDDPANVGQPVAGSNGGIFILNVDGTYSFDPNGNFDDLQVGQSRTTTITYRIIDSQGEQSDTATITVTVGGANDAPTADVIPDRDAADGQILDGDDLNVAAYFDDPEGGALTFAATDLPPGLSMDAAGNITGTIEHDASAGSPYLVTVTATDDQGAIVTRQFAFNVSNPVPAATDDLATITEDQPATIPVLSNDSDPDGDPLTITEIDGNPVVAGDTVAVDGGTVTLNGDGTLTFVPEADFNGQPYFTYTVSDGQGGLSTATVTITITPVNDVPTIDLDGTAAGLDHSTTFTEGSSPVPVSAPDATAFDTEDEIISLDVTLAGFRNGGSEVLHLGTSATIVYGTPSSGTLTIGGSTIAWSYDGTNGLHFESQSGSTDPMSGVEVSALIQSIQYENASDNPTPGERTLSFSATDIEGSMSAPAVSHINIVPVNDPPVIDAPIPDRTYSDSQTVSFDISDNFSDIEGDTLFFTQSGLPAGLSLDPATGEISGQISSDASQLNGGVHTVVITATEPGGGFVQATFTITVTNPPPTAFNDDVTTDENSPLDGSVLAENGNGADIDPDGDDLVVSAVNGDAGNIGVPVAGSAGGMFTLNDDGSFEFDPGTAFDGLKVGESRTTSIAYTISDGQGGTSTAALTVTVIGVNDAPSASASPIVTAEDTPAGGTVTASDLDGDVLTYQLTAPPGNGTLTLDPDTGAYTYTPAANYNGSDSFTITVSDGNGGTVDVVVPVTVTPVNDLPVATNDNISVVQGGTGSGNVITDPAGQDTDIDGDSLAVAAVNGIPGNVATTVAGSAGGTFVINGDGTFTFNAGTDFDYLQAGETATTSIQYTVFDGNGGFATATLTVTVSGANDAPDAEDDFYTTDEDSIGSGNVILDPAGRDTDTDGDDLTVVGVGAPTGGVGTELAGSSGGTFIVNPDGTFTFDPNGDFEDLQAGETQSTTVQYTISDGRGGTATATLTITVEGANDTPAAPALPPQTSADSAAISLDVGSAFSDPDGDTLAFDATGLPPGLAIDPTTGIISGTIENDASGPAGSMTYTVQVTADDGNGGTLMRSFDWTVTNPAPVAQNDQLSVAEDSVLTGSVLADNGQGPDQDIDGDDLTVILTTGPQNGLLVLAPDGTFTYTPNPNFNGTDHFIYQIHDGNGGIATAMVTVTVTPLNDAPVATDDGFTMNEDGSVTIPALANDSDVDNNPLSITAIGGTPVLPGQTVSVVNGAVTLNFDGTLTFVPAQDFNGTIAFDYTVSDGTSTDQATVNGIVNAIDDAPVNTLPPSFSGTEDLPLSLSGLAIADVDAGGGVVTVTLTVDAGTIEADGTAVPAGLTVTGNGTGALVLAGTVDDINAFLATPDAITYRPVPNSFAPVTFVMVTDDGGNTGIGGPLSDSDTATIFLAPVNDNPTATPAAPLSTDEDVPATGQVTADDTDGDMLTYEVTTQPQHGRLVLDPGTGAYTYFPDANYSGADSFTVTVSDGNGGTVPVTVPVTVNPVNDPPTAFSPPVTTIEGTPATGQVIASDVEGDTLTYLVTVPPAHGTLTIDPSTGAYTYTPHPNYGGPDSFTVTVSDGNGGTATVEVPVTVTPVNEAPTASAPALVVTEDTPAGGQIIASDVDGDALTYQVTAQPTHGTLTIDPATGEYIYTPNAGYTGSDSFTITVSDGNGGTAVVTVPVTVTPVAEQPQPPVVMGIETHEPPDILNDRLSFDWRSIALEGEVVNALGHLDSIYGNEHLDGMVTRAVNVFSSLNGISGLPVEGMVAHVVHQMDTWVAGLDDVLLPPLFEGGSSIGSLGGGDRAGQLTVDTIVRDGVIYILTSVKGDGMAQRPDLQITLSDGRALPDWIVQMDDGLAIAHPPADLASIEISVQANTPDGLLEHRLQIDLLTGSIKDGSEERSGMIGPSLFSDQLHAEISASSTEATALASILRTRTLDVPPTGL